MFSFLQLFFSHSSALRPRDSASTFDGRVYLDYAGTASVSARAQAELVRVLSIFGNPSAIHKEGAEASLELDKARAKLARIVNAHSYEITFVGSGTESCNLAVLGTYEGWKKQEVRSKECELMNLNEQRIMNNDLRLPHIITSSIEHPSVLEPIRHLDKKGKVNVTYLPVYGDGIVKVSDIRDVLTSETILVSVMYANNEIGTIQPVKEIGRCIEEWKKDHGRGHNEYPYFHIDACQAGNYLSLDVLRLKAHLMSVNSSKIYGPKGIALLYRREGIQLSPILYGGGQERGLRSGTESVALASSFAEALTESQEMKEKESVRLRNIRDDFKKELEKVLPNVMFYGAFEEGRYKIINNKQQTQNFETEGEKVKRPTSNGQRVTTRRLPNNLNFRIPGIESEEMILRLDAKGFAVSHKSACASQEDDGSYVIQALGATEEEAQENIRVTLGRDTIWKDLKRLVDTIVDITKKYSK